MKYDLCILGSGPAGYSAALHAASLKMRVVLLSGDHDNFGGTCLNEGCIPLKIWNTAARYMQQQAQSENFGLPSAMLSIDWLQTFKKFASKMPEDSQDIIEHFLKTTPLEEFVCVEKAQRINWLQLCQYTKTICKNLRDDMLTRLKLAGITVLEERGRLLNAHRIATASTVIEADNILLAAGTSEKKLSDVISLPIIMHLSELPARLAIVGAGVLGCELATIFQKLGVKILLLEKNKRILPEWDGECAQWLHENMTRQGTKIVTGWNGCDMPHDHVCLNAMGRIPSTAELGLEAVGIDIDDQGYIPVNESQQTSVPNIYAAGDLCGNCSTASMAEIQGCRVVEYMAGKQPLPIAGYQSLAIFATPELASVGLTAEQCEERKIAFASAKYPLAALGHTLIDSDNDGFVKVIYEKGLRKLLGIHIAGGPAAEMIAAAGFAVNAGASLDDYCRLSWIHPSYGEALNKVMVKAMNRYKNKNDLLQPPH